MASKLKLNKRVGTQAVRAEQEQEHKERVGGWEEEGTTPDIKNIIYKAPEVR